MPDRIALAFEEEEEYSAARLEALAAWKQAETEHALAVTHPAHAVGDHPVLAGLMPMLESYDLSSLRFIMWGATPVTPSVAQAVTRRTGVGWLPAYGAGELPVIACNPLDHPRLPSGKVLRRVLKERYGRPSHP